MSADILQEVSLTSIERDSQHLDHLEEAGHLKVELFIDLAGQQGELGLEQSFGMLQVGKGPGLEPVTADNLAEVGRAQSALKLDLAQQVARRPGSVRARTAAPIAADWFLIAGSSNEPRPVGLDASTRMTTLSMSG